VCGIHTGAVTLRWLLLSQSTNEGKDPYLVFSPLDCSMLMLAFPAGLEAPLAAFSLLLASLAGGFSGSGALLSLSLLWGSGVAPPAAAAAAALAAFLAALSFFLAMINEAAAPLFNAKVVGS
jgi:hypothetical protein